jgi:Acetyltransferase (GNAT) domain
VTQLERVSIDDPRWREFVDAAPDATVFHRGEWVSVLADTYRLRVFAVIAIERSTLVAGAPFLAVGGPFRRRWSSLPFTDACAPLGDPAAVSAFVGRLGEFAAKHGISSVELRAVDRPRPEGSLAIAVRHILPLDREAGATLRGVAPSHARNARHAERAGVDRGRELPERRRHLLRAPCADAAAARCPGTAASVLPAPRRAHHRARPRLHPDGAPRGPPARGGRVPRVGRILVFEYGASDEREWAHRPNDLLFWTAIDAACREGYANLDLGRTDIADAGLRRLKSAWGARETDLAYTVLGADQKKATGWTRDLLRPLIRHSSPIVCRALGEALYRYSA